MSGSPAVAGRRRGFPYAALRRAYLLSCSGWRPSLQSIRRINCSTVSARMPNIRWHHTLPGPPTLRCRPPNSSLSRPFTRSTVERSRVRLASGDTWPMRRYANASRFRLAFTCGRLRGLRSMIGTSLPEMSETMNALQSLLSIRGRQSVCCSDGLRNRPGANDPSLET